MGVYGSRNKRKRAVNAISDDSFSSDDGEFLNSSRTTVEENTLSLKIDRKTVMGLSVNGPFDATRRSIDGDIQKEKAVSELQSSVQDEIQKSPRKYRRMLKNLEESPIQRVSPFDDLSPIKIESKGKIDTSLKAALESSQRLQDSYNRVTSSLKESPKKTSAEKSAWENLLGELDSTAKLTARKLTPPRIRWISSSVCQPQEGLAEHHEAYQVDLDKIRQSLEQKIPENNSPATLAITTSYALKKSFTYGGNRSFLVDQNESEDAQKISDETESYLSDDLEHESSTESTTGFPKDSVDINELRILGKRNNIRDELEYLLEGIVYQTKPGIVERNNAILISTLMHLCVLNNQFLEHTLDPLLARLERIEAEIISCCNGDQLIKFLIQVFLRKILAEEISRPEEMSPKLLLLAFKNISFEAESLQLPNMILDSVNKLNVPISITELVEILKEKEFIYSTQIYEEINKNWLGDYFVEYFARSPYTAIKTIQPHVDTAFEKIKNQDLGEHVSQILKVLVLTSAKASQFNFSYLSPLLDLVGNVCNQLSEKQIPDKALDCCLLSLGCILNHIEWHKPTDSDTVSKIKKILQSIEDVPQDSEFAVHLSGYVSIIASFYADDILVSRHHTREKLKRFQDSIDNNAIVEKIQVAMRRFTNV